MTITMQQTINLDDPNAVQLPVSTPNGYITTWVDESTVDLLAGRRLSLGSHGYVACWEKGTMTVLHRLIMGCQPGDGRYVDHLDGDRLNNLRANLRIVTAAENNANRVCGNPTGYRGVHRRGDRYEAYGKRNGVSYRLGVYDTAEEAGEVAHQWRLKNLPGYTGSPRTRYSNAPLMLAAVNATA